MFIDWSVCSSIDPFISIYHERTELNHALQLICWQSRKGQGYFSMVQNPNLGCVASVQSSLECCGYRMGQNVCWEAGWLHIILFRCFLNLEKRIRLLRQNLDPLWSCNNLNALMSGYTAIIPTARIFVLDYWIWGNLRYREWKATEAQGITPTQNLAWFVPRIILWVTILPRSTIKGSFRFRNPRQIYWQYLLLDLQKISQLVVHFLYVHWVV